MPLPAKAGPGPALEARPVRAGDGSGWVLSGWWCDDEVCGACCLSFGGELSSHAGPNARKNHPSDPSYHQDITNMDQPGIPSPPTARSLLSKLRVSRSEPGTGYSRAKFPHWETIDDGCNVRGRWTSPYDGETVDDASEIDIDHLVPLKNAWISGASHWEASRRRTFANDLSSPQLWAVTAHANRQKGDDSPDEWLPSVEGFRCVYAESWVRVKDKYGLTVTREEREALEGVLGASSLFQTSTASTAPTPPTITIAITGKPLLPCSVPAADNVSIALLHPDEAPLMVCSPGLLRFEALRLEKALSNDHPRAIHLRRLAISPQHTSRLPYHDYDWSRVSGTCCENVIGYVPLPVGTAGPLLVDGTSYAIPMATTEGTLVASTSRGCKAINLAGGADTVLTADGITRGPCVSFPSLVRAAQAKTWLDSKPGWETMRSAFDSTSSFARLQSIKTALAGSQLFIRFKASTGDAMGMNMISKGVEKALNVMAASGFTDMAITSVSGNYCADKKASALNWIEGRGKSVVAEAVIPPEVVRSVLKTDVDSLVELNTSKNLVGSAMAGCVGGFNAHAANIVAALFLATGQDAAQVVESANCITMMKNVGGNLQVSVSMPSIEVGTIGGGTNLEPQAAMLNLLGVHGTSETEPGEKSRRLARIVAAAVLAGELSLCSALAAGHLVGAHMRHNRARSL
ncbi:hypothetical protein CDD80_7081 [Ophiocordyceps camponoti-rufipedis]|uniref:3-hydroxy-3-methylglutaryl coenzyme A reductase n=1 Tax=Ophiocordyceps camponoti-rufipedis TaxID=2004952 RepID=A0A2C5YNC8_9HYPO|nr:hypothetical protein CDD80_7081 [Ophiocordyceps camponoti-rufipedis]